MEARGQVRQGGGARPAGQCGMASQLTGQGVELPPHPDSPGRRLRGEASATVRRHRSHCRRGACHVAMARHRAGRRHEAPSPTRHARGAAGERRGARGPERPARDRSGHHAGLRGRRGRREAGIEVVVGLRQERQVRCAVERAGEEAPGDALNRIINSVVMGKRFRKQNQGGSPNFGMGKVPVHMNHNATQVAGLGSLARWSMYPY